MSDEANVQGLLAVLDSNGLQARLEAIRQLGEQRVAAAVPRLLELLADPNLEIRLGVITALGKIGDGRAVPFLAEIADTTTPIIPPSTNVFMSADEIARLMASDLALNALTQIGTPEALVVVERVRSRPVEPQKGFAAQHPPSEAEEAAGALDDQDEALDLEDAVGAVEEPPEPEPLAPPSPAPAVAPPPRLIVPQPAAPERRRERELEQQGDRVKKADDVAETIQFSAYYPREVRPADWQPLQAYIFKESVADDVAADAEKQLGPLARFRRILENARHSLSEGAMITATPTLPGFQFNPPSITLGFFEDWQRFEFKMRATDAPLNVAANGVLTFFADGIIAADLPLAVFVTQDVTDSLPQATPTLPIYDTVFASYSHKDTAVVEKVETAAKAFGMTYLRDVITLRSGEDWSAGLEKMIGDATIFQLFWSVPYSQSMHCRREWEYAVNLQREAIRFIRPVYWLQPMPDPPPPLQHLHFTYQPDLIKP